MNRRPSTTPRNADTHLPLRREVGEAYLTTTQVATMTGYSARALETMRHRGMGPRYYRCGRSIRYRCDDVHAWFDNHAVSPGQSHYPKNAVRAVKRGSHIS